MRFIILMVLVCVPCSLAYIPGGPREKFQRFPTLDNYWALSGYLSELTSRSVTGCSTRCTKDLLCVSFFYEPVNRACQLHAYKYETRTAFVTRPNTQYYSMRDVVAPFNATCVLAPPDPAYSTVLLSDGTLFTYRIGWESVTQWDAQSICQSEGGMLMRILTKTKMDAIGTILTACDGYFYEFWTDGTNIDAVDKSNISSWVTSLGEMFPTEPSLADYWYPTEPLDPQLENCVTIYGGVDDINLWVSWPCQELYSYICEK